MRAGKFSLLMAAVAMCAASFPGSAFAESTATGSLTGSVNLTWNLYEGSQPYNGSGQYNSQNPIAVNGMLSCPGSAVICGAFGEGGNHAWSVGTDTITYLGTGDTGQFGTNPVFTTNSWTFSGITFTNGGHLEGFQISNNTAALTYHDVSINGSSITIDLAGTGVNRDGTFTLTLSETPMATPEPSSFVMSGTGLLGILLFVVRRRKGFLPGNRAGAPNFG